MQIEPTHEKHKILDAKTGIYNVKKDFYIDNQYSISYL